MTDYLKEYYRNQYYERFRYACYLDRLIADVDSDIQILQSAFKEMTVLIEEMEMVILSVAGCLSKFSEWIGKNAGKFLTECTSEGELYGFYKRYLDSMNYNRAMLGEKLELMQSARQNLEIRKNSEISSSEYWYGKWQGYE